MNIGFYGAGKVGTSLAIYFKQQGLAVSGFYSRNAAQAKESATLSATAAFSTIEALVKQSDWIFITVSDTYIEHVAAQLMPHLQHHVLFHCSGAAPSHILQVPNAYAFHPLYAFPSKETPLNEQVLFTLEGSPNVEAIKQQLATLGNPIQIIEAHQKAKYHAACVMVSNFVNGLVYAGQQMFESIGFSEETATQAYKHLFWQNAQNIFERGAVAALTGPIERNDVTTIEKHLQALEASEKEVYATLAKLVIDTAQVKYPAQSYDVLKRKF
ncbi:Rossmann-like and DUF2520 domain-containing protein [Kurthia massiliensis]|uniref:Rossmann-like and DUF2520 domain-containing protein n=1 Tax=Kurthia massiliensis TaxID=1033739 RepID=UPI000288CE3D|nr:Rossmann-like and DUF2520 domain-containing protein [Kurthia massiliensis]